MRTGGYRTSFVRRPYGIGKDPSGHIARSRRDGVRFTTKRLGNGLPLETLKMSPSSQRLEWFHEHDPAVLPIYVAESHAIVVGWYSS